VVVALEAGPRLVVVAGGLEQELQRPLVDLARERIQELGLGRVEQVDPLGDAAETTFCPG
jgi:hypothetical protein